MGATIERSKDERWALFGKLHIPSNSFCFTVAGAESAEEAPRDSDRLSPPKPRSCAKIREGNLFGLVTVQSLSRKTIGIAYSTRFLPGGDISVLKVIGSCLAYQSQAAIPRRRPE